MNDLLPVPPADPSSFPIELYGVADAGSANMERVVLRAKEAVDLSYFGLMISMSMDDGTFVPIRDNLLWFGAATVNKGDWLFIYTAPGEFKEYDLKDGSGAKIYSIHWNRTETIFQNRRLTPSLFHMNLFMPALRNDVPQPPHKVQRTGDQETMQRHLGA